MDFNIDKILERRTAQAKVGDKMLTIQPFVAARHTEFANIVKKLDLEKRGDSIVAAIRPIIDAAESVDKGSWMEALLAQGPKILGMGLDLLGPEGGELLTAAAQIALDNADNHDVLRKAFSEGTEPVEEFGIFISSPAVRTWVKHNITLAQALHVLQEAIKLTGYDELGKALKGALMGLLVPQEAPTPPKVNAKTPRART